MMLTRSAPLNYPDIRFSSARFSNRNGLGCALKLRRSSMNSFGPLRFIEKDDPIRSMCNITRMEVKAKKKVRFDAVIKEAGQPVQVTLWTKPEEDRDFIRAVKEKRVATVIQHNVGTKKDYGLAGFYPQDRATYLIFPKPLGLPEETKIVGIKYD